MSSKRSRVQPNQRPAWSREKLIRERAIALGSAVAISTSESYSSAMRSWIHFCTIHEFSTEPNLDSLSFYVTYMSHFVSPRTVDSYLSGICNKLEPYFPHVRRVRTSLLVGRTLKGCKRLHNVAIQRKRALTIEDLDLLTHHYASSQLHNDLLFLAIVTTGFFTLQRLGELVQPDKLTLRSARKLPLRHTVQVRDSELEYILPAHKADAFFDGNKILLQKTNQISDAFRHFTRFLHSRDQLFPYYPQLFLTSSGSVPTRAWFISRLRKHFPNDVAGHSMRSGGATALALAGVPDDRIQSLGRWSSDAYQTYIQKNPVLVQSFIWGRPTFNNNQ